MSLLDVYYECSKRSTGSLDILTTKATNNISANTWLWLDHVCFIHGSKDKYNETIVFRRLIGMLDKDGKPEFKQGGIKIKNCLIDEEDIELADDEDSIELET